jgi:Tfp pilus assembly protein PilE
MNDHQPLVRKALGRNNENGVLLVDAMIAMAVFSIGIMALIALQAMATRIAGQNTRDAAAASCLVNQIETLWTLPYNNNSLDTDTLMSSTCEGGDVIVNWIVFDKDSNNSISAIVADNDDNSEFYDRGGMFHGVNTEAVLTNIPENTKMIMLHSRHVGDSKPRFTNVYLKPNI